MKLIYRLIISIGIAAVLALPVAATAAEPQGMNAVQLLSHATGLTERQVKLVVGNRYIGYFAPYRASYHFADKRFRKAVGPEMYEYIKRHGELTEEHVQALVAMASARQVEIAEIGN